MIKKPGFKGLRTWQPLQEELCREELEVYKGGENLEESKWGGEELQDFKQGEEELEDCKWEGEELQDFK